MARLDLRKVKHVSRFDLAEKLGDKPLTVGRSSDNDVVLADTHVSRHHCIIEVIEGETRIRDLKSHGGTFVNGRKIEQCTLHHGDRISIGPFDLLFKDPSAAHVCNGELPLALANDDTGTHHPGDSSRSATGIKLRDLGSSAIDHDLQTRSAELEAREATLKEREASLQALKLELDQRRTSALKQDAERISALQKALDQARSELVAATDRNDELLGQALTSEQAATDLRTRLADLMRERDQACESRDQSESALDKLREHVSKLEAQIGQHATRIDELHGAVKTRQEMLDQFESRSNGQVRSLEQSLEAAHREIERLKSHETTLQEQVEALESARRALAERAEHSNRALAVLRGQVRSLDNAAQRVTAIQSQLAEIENAWVDLDQQLESAQEQDDEQLEQAAMRRQQISDELQALNDVRDAAVADLSESAQHLRAATEQQAFQITTVRPIPRAERPSSARATATAGGGGRPWWKFGR